MAEKSYAYLLPGMGADKRLFNPIELKGVKVKVLEWEFIPGISTMSEYAAHLAKRISTENNVYIGSSMGGMMAVELHKAKPAKNLVLLSAPACRLEFPPILKGVSRIKAGKWFSLKQMHRFNRLADLFMGFSSPDHRILFYEMLEGYGPEFLKFSVNAILEWDRMDRPEKYLQVIGSKDRLFKAHRMQSPIVLPGSGHFLTYEQPVELSRIVNEYLDLSEDERHKSSLY